MSPSTRLTAALLEVLDDRLAGTDAWLAEHDPGEDGRRQPVHTVYVAADRYTPTLPREWGERARRLVAEHGGLTALATEVGLAPEVTAAVVSRVAAKLAVEPIEDLRLDFEDGYGDRGEETEDAEAVRAARALAEAVADGLAPPFAGVRIKSLEGPTRRRGVRTLDAFLTALLEYGDLPDGLVITLPKVSTVSQVEAMAEVCGAYEQVAGLTAGRLRFEVQVETPALVVGADGRLPLPAAVAAGGGRVSALHFGTYDYSAALGIAAGEQSLAHPAADFAKQVMQVAAAGTGVRLSDGSTNVLPTGTPEQVRAGWRLHHDLVRRSMERGFYQGWDLHPGHLPTRFLATFAFFWSGFGPAANRLAGYLARREGNVQDEPATARALALFLRRGVGCGALDVAELRQATGLDAAELDRLVRRDDGR